MYFKKGSENVGNSNLNAAKTTKDDEFYTCYDDIEKELFHYRKHFKNKIVFCNCDNSEKSNFWKYFYTNFEDLKLKKLISTYYEKDKTSYMTEYDGHNITKMNLNGNGDFRNEECIKILQFADIIVTNPPFSLFRDYIEQMIAHDKQFLIIGNINAMKYKTIFPYFMKNKIWFGYNSVKKFTQPNGDIKKFGNVCWYTNLDIDKRHEKIELVETYLGNEDKYPKYDNYNAIEVGRVKDIPKDYDGIMGVPISFLNKYSPEQFEIVGEFNHGSDGEFDLAKPIIEGKELFPRIAIKNIKNP